MRRGMTSINRIKVLIFSLAIIFVSLVVSRAESPSQPPRDEIQEPQYAPDEILIKLKPEAHERMSITTDVDENLVTGLTSLDKLNQKHGATKMKQILDKASGKPKRKLTPKAEQMRQNLRRIYKIN